MNYIVFVQHQYNVLRIVYVHLPYWSKIMFLLLEKTSENQLFFVYVLLMDYQNIGSYCSHVRVFNAFSSNWYIWHSFKQNNCRVVLFPFLSACIKQGGGRRRRSSSRRSVFFQRLSSMRTDEMEDTSLVLKLVIYHICHNWNFIFKCIHNLSKISGII